MSKYLDPKRPFPFCSGWGTRGKRKTQPYEPGTVCGYLTAVKQSAGAPAYTLFICRCGTQETRRHADVREAVAKGGIPSCPKCRKAAILEAKSRREAANA